ncbi:MAG TPA: hypothetical protein VIY54_07890 [Steroidobacteraceae bacterium]
MSSKSPSPTMHDPAPAKSRDPTPPKMQDPPQNPPPQPGTPEPVRDPPIQDPPVSPEHDREPGQKPGDRVVFDEEEVAR